MTAFQSFVKLEGSSGILLLVCALCALAWANLDSGSYQSLLQMTVGFRIGNFEMTKSLHHWINDGLMAVFFLLVGLEIKREFLVGELAEPRKAMLPVAAALGGAAIPALLYLLFNFGGPGASGWAIPAATDIAFALGILALIGRRAPVSLQIFLAALAIVDDLAALVIIALFYTEKISWVPLGWAAGILVFLFILNRQGVRPLPFYLIPGLFLWLAIFKSGLHATLAGVLLAIVIPSWTRQTPAGFVSEVTKVLNSHDPSGPLPENFIHSQGAQDALHHVEMECKMVQPPLLRLEHLLHPWSAFLIIPVFALANAGVTIQSAELLLDPVALGVMVGLVLGKPIGILGACYLAVRFGGASLPEGTGWNHIVGVSLLAGIGFTMSLFIAGLAFTDIASVEAAKLGVLVASTVAGGLGATLLIRAGSQDPESSRDHRRGNFES